MAFGVLCQIMNHPRYCSYFFVSLLLIDQALRQWYLQPQEKYNKTEQLLVHVLQDLSPSLARFLDLEGVAPACYAYSMCI